MRFSVVLVSSLFVLALGPGPSQSQPQPQPQSQPQQPAAAPETPLPLFCTLTSAHSCTGQACVRVEALGDLKLPAKMLIHFENRMVASTSSEGFPHISQIASLASTAGDHVLQGVDHAVGWMIHLDEAGSKMTIAMTSNEKILTGAGTCRRQGS